MRRHAAETWGVVVVVVVGDVVDIIHTQACIHTRTRTHTHTHAHMHARKHTCMHAHHYTHVHTHEHAPVTTHAHPKRLSEVMSTHCSPDGAAELGRGEDEIPSTAAAEE